MSVPYHVGRLMDVDGLLNDPGVLWGPKTLGLISKIINSIQGYKTQPDTATIFQYFGSTNSYPHQISFHLFPYWSILVNILCYFFRFSQLTSDMSCWRFNFQFSLPAIFLGGCPHNAIRGADQFSDKEAVRLMNPCNVKKPLWDSVGSSLFMQLGYARLISVGHCVGYCWANKSVDYCRFFIWMMFFGIL